MVTAPADAPMAREQSFRSPRRISVYNKPIPEGHEMAFPV